MLVLSRYRDESIIIGDEVKVTIVDIRGDRVRIGIQAPANVTVHRQEVYEAITNKPSQFEKPQPPQQAEEVPPKFSSPLRRELEARKAKTITSIEIDGKLLGISGIQDIIGQ
ncbi:hypothetical protein FACS189419_08710 [Planctomycetales bacterium]|nr:hypothetical protein FACS189419_08710 [Planctomycetales bacterium]